MILAVTFRFSIKWLITLVPIEDKMSHHLFLTCSWSPDFCVGFKVGICWWERMDTAFLILLKCSWVN